MISYVLYHILGGNDILFVFMLSIISYSCLFSALYKFNKYIGASKIVFITSGMTLGFFPYIFAISIHLVRQFMGFSICLFGIISFMSDRSNRKYLYLLLSCLSVFIHTSSAFILGLFLIPLFRTSINKKNAILFAVFCVCFLSFSQIAQTILPFFADTSFAYGLGKLANGTTFQSVLPMIQIVFVSSISILSIFSFYTNHTMKKNPLAAYVVNTLIFLLIFVLINYRVNIEMAARFLYDIVILVPFVTSIVIYKVKNISLHICGQLILFVFWVYYNQNMSDWTYTCVDYFWLYSTIMYLI